MSDIDNDPKKPRGDDIEPPTPVAPEPGERRPSDEGRIQYEDEVSEDVQKRPSNPDQLSQPQDKGRRLENPLLAPDE